MKILDCPCGATPYISEQEEIAFIGWYWEIWCKKCGLSVESDDRGWAIELWNERVKNSCAKS